MKNANKNARVRDVHDPESTPGAHGDGRTAASAVRPLGNDAERTEKSPWNETSGTCFHADGKDASPPLTHFVDPEPSPGGVAPRRRPRCSCPRTQAIEARPGCCAHLPLGADPRAADRSSEAALTVSRLGLRRLSLDAPAGEARPRRAASLGARSTAAVRRTSVGLHGQGSSAGARGKLAPGRATPCVPARVRLLCALHRAQRDERPPEGWSSKEVAERRFDNAARVEPAARTRTPDYSRTQPYEHTNVHLSSHRKAPLVRDRDRSDATVCRQRRGLPRTETCDRVASRYRPLYPGTQPRAAHARRHRTIASRGSDVGDARRFVAPIERVGRVAKVGEPLRCKWHPGRAGIGVGFRDLPLVREQSSQDMAWKPARQGAAVYPTRLWQGRPGLNLASERVRVRPASERILRAPIGAPAYERSAEGWSNKEVARATNGSEGACMRPQREPSPAYSLSTSYVQDHQTHSREAGGSEELAHRRARSTSTPPRPYPRHGRALRRGRSAPRVRCTFQPQQGSACPHPTDLPATAGPASARDREQGDLARAGDPDGVALERSIRALVASGPSVRGPGSSSRGTGGGAIRRPGRSCVRPGSRAEGPRFSQQTTGGPHGRPD